MNENKEGWAAARKAAAVKQHIKAKSHQGRAAAIETSGASSGGARSGGRGPGQQPPGGEASPMAAAASPAAAFPHLLSLSS